MLASAQRKAVVRTRGHPARLCALLLAGEKHRGLHAQARDGAATLATSSRGGRLSCRSRIQILLQENVTKN